MRRILHILTQPNDELAAEIVARQRQEPECHIVVADLAQPNPDYPALLEAIFEADSVQVW